MDDRCCGSHFSGFGKYKCIFPQLQIYTTLVPSADCTEGSCSSNILISNNFLVFNFPFFLISIISFFLGMYSLLVFDVVLHYQLNAFKIPKMVQYNHISLMISVNNAKYIHLLPIFHFFQSFSYCKYKPFINWFQSYLFCYKCWLFFQL